MASSSRWCFTLNNYEPSDLTKFREFGSSAACRYLVFGREVGAQNGTPHLQGFVIFRRTVRRAVLLRLLSPRLHLEVAVASSEEAADYCKKDGDFEQFGSFPDQRGKRTDLERAIEWADTFHATDRRCITLRDVAMSHPTIAIKFPRFIEVLQARYDPEPLMDLDGVELHDWQRELEEKLDATPDDRSINFVVDIIGGKGKTFFAHYMQSKKPDAVQILSVAKRDDLAYMLDENKSIFFFNVPRTGMEFFQYTIVEMIKDKLVISPKYQSRVKRMLPAHVVVLSNEYPDREKLSADRVNIIELI